MIYHEGRIFGTPTKTGTVSLESWARRNGGVVLRPRHTPVVPYVYRNAARYQLCRPPAARLVSMFRYLSGRSAHWGMGRYNDTSFQSFLDFWAFERAGFLKRARRRSMEELVGWDWLSTQTEFREIFRPHFYLPVHRLASDVGKLNSTNRKAKTLPLGRYRYPALVRQMIEQDRWAETESIVTWEPL